MNFEEYQAAAAATAEAPAYDHQYLIPGIVSEFGELQSHRAKAFWHGRDEQQTAHAVLLEYGDMMWLTAIALQACGINSEAQFPQPARNPRFYSNQAPEAIVANAVHRVFMTWLDEDPSNLLTTYWSHLWVALVRFAEPITGEDADTAMRENIAKLATRVKHGTLRGDGDYR